MRWWSVAGLIVAAVALRYLYLLVDSQEHAREAEEVSRERVAQWRREENTE